jgi:hypothetical protein
MNGEPRQASQRFRDVRTGEVSCSVVNYPRRRQVVKFRPDESLDLTPLLIPPPPPTPEQIECRQLATELLAQPVDDQIMAKLQQGADISQSKAWCVAPAFARSPESRLANQQCGRPDWSSGQALLAVKGGENIDSLMP